MLDSVSTIRKNFTLTQISVQTSLLVNNEEGSNKCWASNLFAGLLALAIGEKGKNSVARGAKCLNRSLAFTPNIDIVKKTYESKR